MHPLVILILLAMVLIFISWYKRAPKAARTNALIYGGAALLVLVALTKGQWLVALLGGGLAAMQRIMTATQLFNRLKSMGGPSAGNRSDVRTAFLEMSLDHDSGQLTGRVIKGSFEGRRLDDLSLENLLDLMRECRTQDSQSVSVLESYLDRRFGVAWREQSDPGASSSSIPKSQMSRDEAYDILGIARDATREQIVEAHKRLMQRVHPDRGGSTYLAARINQAKHVLLAS